MSGIARDSAIRSRSRSTFAQEIRTCQRLGLSGLVMHPVGDTDADEDAVLARVADSLNAVFDEVPFEGTIVLLETTAGQGANVGYRFEQLARIIDGVEQDARLGICVDTCHVFAAGYDISGKTGWRKMMSELEATVGLARLKAIHLNDSRKPCGSRVDRHAHIGLGDTDRAFEWLQKAIEARDRAELRALLDVFAAAGAIVTLPSGLTGPAGQNVSNPLARLHWPSARCRWRSATRRCPTRPRRRWSVPAPSRGPTWKHACAPRNRACPRPR